MKWSKELEKYMVEYPNTEGIEREIVEQVENSIEYALMYLSNGQYNKACILLEDSVQLMKRLEK